MWTADDIKSMVYAANMGLEPTREDMAWLRDKTTLLPPQLLTQLDERSLLRGIPKLERPDVSINSPELLAKILDGQFDDKEFESMFPARTKIDLGIRRARARTIYMCYATQGKLEEWKRWIPRLGNMDYITVCCLMLAHLIHDKWLDFWHRVDCLRSMEDFQEVAKHVSNLLKKFPAPMELRLRYCEASTMCGYRNPPFQNFDYFGESRKLAEGGESHGLIGDDWLNRFTAAADDVQGSSVPGHVKFMTLEEYIGSDLAQTGGASTFGKIEWEFEGEEGKFKARKNFLLDIATAKYLAEQTMEHLGYQVNKSFIKPELGKMRIAVTGDIWSYFSQSWLNYLAGAVYLQWPGNTMDERIGQQTERMFDMRKAADKAYPLPFDFAAFDHQPQTSEVEVLSRSYLERGIVNVPFEHLDVFNKVLNSTVVSFSHATIVAREGDETKDFKVEGGLPSGIRLTSLVGNYWNSTMTLIAKENLQRMGVTEKLTSWLRGDDSAIYAKTYWSSLLMRLSYAAINAVGNDSKYGIHWQQSEFLRVWYGTKKCYGYPNRAIPGIIQRKPWGSEPWDPEGVIAAQLSTVCTLERRLDRNLDWLRDVLCLDWSRIRHQTTRWLRLPRTLGGLGMLSFQGWVSSKPWPSVDHPKIKFKNIEPDSWNVYAQRYEEWGLTENEAREIQQETMISKAASDDIRGLGKVFRDKYKTELKMLGTVEWRRVDIKVFPTESLSGGARLLGSLNSKLMLEQVMRSKAATFGEFQRLAQWWKELQTVCRYRDLKPVLELQKYNASAYMELRRLERKGLHRAAALDYMFGSIRGLVVGRLNPLLSGIVEAAMSHSVEAWALGAKKWNRETWSWFTSTVANWYGESLNESQLSQTLFQW